MMDNQFEQKLVDVVTEELADKGIHAMITGYVLILECDHGDGEGSDFIVGMEPLHQRSATTYGLIDFYASSRRDDFIINALGKGGK